MTELSFLGELSL